MLNDAINEITNWELAGLSIGALIVLGVQIYMLIKWL
jgi:hypothetical protein